MKKFTEWVAQLTIKHPRNCQLSYVMSPGFRVQHDATKSILGFTGSISKRYFDIPSIVGLSTAAMESGVGNIRSFVDGTDKCNWWR